MLSVCQGVRSGRTEEWGLDKNSGYGQLTLNCYLEAGRQMREQFSSKDRTLASRLCWT